MQKAADELLEQEESSYQANYDAAAMKSRQVSEDQKKLRWNLKMVKHRISELRHAVAMDAQQESDDDVKAQHFLMGASDAQSIVQEDTEQRDADVNKIQLLQNRRNKLDQTLARSLQRKVQVEARLKRLVKTKRRLKKSRRKSVLLLAIYQKELKRARHQLAVNSNASVFTEPSSQNLKIESQLATDLHAPLHLMQDKDSTREHNLASEEQDTKSVMHRAEMRYQKSRTFWRQSKASLAKVETNANANIMELHKKYDTSIQQARKADQIASTAVHHVRNPAFKQQDVGDLELALQQAHLEAQLVQNTSNSMIRQALDLVASVELDSLETGASSGEKEKQKNGTFHKDIGIVGQAQTKVAVSALHHAHSTVKQMKAFTGKFASAQKVWDSAVATTQNAVLLAHRVMMANLHQWELARKSDQKLKAKYKSEVAKDSSNIQNLTQSNNLAIKTFERNVTDSTNQKFQKEMAPYKTRVQQQSHRLQQKTKEVQRLELQLDQVQHEQAKDLVLQTILKQKVQQVKQEHNLTLAQLKAAGQAESSAESAVKYVTHTAQTLQRQGDNSLSLSKRDKQEAQKAQVALQKALDMQRKFQNRLVGLENTASQDQSKVIQLLASWRLSQAARRQAPLILDVAGLTASSKSAEVRAQEEVAVMQSSFYTLSATLSKFNGLQQKCSLSKGRLKAANFGVRMSVKQVADYRALQLEITRAATESHVEQVHTKMQATSQNRPGVHHLISPRTVQFDSVSSEAVQQRHKVVSRKLQVIGACRRSKEVHVRVKRLQQKILNAEAKSIAQNRAADHQVRPSPAHSVSMRARIICGSFQALPE